MDLSRYGITGPSVVRNPSPPVLYELALREEGTVITSTGALAVTSGAKTGRSPKDKRVVRHPASEADVWWGDVNVPFPEESFEECFTLASQYLSSRDSLFVVDGFAGWDETYRLKVRVVCERPYHELFMHNMLIRPTEEELAAFGEPDCVILNAGKLAANRSVPGVTSETCVALSFERKMLLILGTEYAGEMKKGVFTLMNYLMPKQGVLSMHCSATEGAGGDVSVIFGLSGTGKTTLSADPKRMLVGDDEHCWTDEGVFNIEGGCYAKCINLSEASEPDIYRAIRFGTVLENVVVDRRTGIVDFADGSVTQNTRASYPLEFIPNVKLPCVAGHPKNVIFLTCDAFGVLPPVAKLSPEEAMYHFISGYTAKVAGTEQGVTEPEATFSACFGAAFMVWHPMVYAELLAEKIRTHGAQAWLVNTGWSGGPFGEGGRMKLSYTRAIMDAIHEGALEGVEFEPDPVFGFLVPKECPNVPAGILVPRNTWRDADRFDRTVAKLARRFRENFAKYEAGCSEAVRNAGPKVVSSDNR